MKKISLLFILLVSVSFSLLAQQKITVNGYIKNAGNGEDLIGASVFVRDSGAGAITNMYGFYSLTVEPGSYTLEFRYLGYATEVRAVELSANTRLDVELRTEQQQLDEVVVTASGDRLKNTEMSTEKLDAKAIKTIPPFLGETDVIKSIQFLPGVTTVGEGA